MYTVKVNDSYDFSVSTENKEISVDGKEILLDRISLNGTTQHVLYQNKSYTIELVSLDRTDKTAIVTVNGNVYTVSLTDQFDLLLKQLGMDNLAAAKVTQIKAPMPGLVLNLLIAEGDEIKKGDNLLVLEAMKMENMIKSPTDGMVKNISVRKGDKVEKNQVLIQFS